MSYPQSIMDMVRAILKKKYNIHETDDNTIRSALDHSRRVLMGRRKKGKVSKKGRLHSLLTPPSSPLRLNSDMIGMSIGDTGIPQASFVSAEQREKVPFEDALASVGGEDQKRLAAMASHLYRQNGLGDSTVMHALGRWDGGQEASTMSVIPHPLSVQMARGLASTLGALHRQKAVIAFQPDVEGPDHFFRLVVPGIDHGTLSNLATSAGIPDHTVIPDMEGNDPMSHLVYVSHPYSMPVDQAKQRLLDFRTALKMRGFDTFKYPLYVSSGFNHYIGADDRDEAQKIYQEEIKALQHDG